MYTRKTSIAVAKRELEMEVSTSSSSPTRTRARSGEPIYAPNSLDKILTGNAYARAVRAHTLLHLTLATIISKEFVIDDDMDANLQNTIEDVKNNTISYNDNENCDEKTEASVYQCNKKLKHIKDEVLQQNYGFNIFI
ncbi:hypothetical protein AVEN_152698-1 [Araneus ventricosus]|uniref:Uncharacterized protein n=1 Tax=Araneus ventricosus TaxID=182803 RepID=A0A4Y2ST52_ARAVE|nr:hypothetical protein AVEN_105166-1 [Araneus ventricosus]GBN90435.1 hypothetical protein AVEN_152698-1 [Araneus ventricosus]